MIRWTLSQPKIVTLERVQRALTNTWHPDEFVVSVQGRKHWLWRAVGKDGFVLDVLVQSRRNAAAAERLMRKLLRQHGTPRVIVTDKLRSYGAAKKKVMPGVEHRAYMGLKNRSENSHLHVRRRERVMKCFKSPGRLQRFVSIHDPIANLFHLPRHEMPASDFREMRALANEMWREIAELADG